MRSAKIKISGMHCRSCELVIERNLLGVPGIRKVGVNHNRGEAEVFYADVHPSRNAIERAVLDAGYRLGEVEKKPWFSKNSGDYVELLTASSILFALYLFAGVFGLTDLNFSFSSSPTYPVAFLIGLAAGVSTCMALIGGLVLGISARHAELHPEATRIQKFRPHLFFNLGRVFAYAAAGGALAALGSRFEMSPIAMGALVFAAGALMTITGVKLTEVFPRFASVGLSLPKGISRMLGIHKETREYGHGGSALLGALTVFLPCGFTQTMMVFAAATGSVTSGALSMFFFALGTAPGLLGIGGLTSVVRGASARLFFKTVGVAVIAFGLWNIANGFNLTGWTLPSFGFARQTEKAVVALSGRMENGVRVLDMTQGNGYYPNQFTVEKGVPVKWVVNATNPYVCTSVLVVPVMNIRRTLISGINIIEFIPTRAGPLRFSCGMGMATGQFNVIE